MKTTILALLGFLLMQSLSFATPRSAMLSSSVRLIDSVLTGNDRGNGGDAVVCFTVEGEVEHVTLLDHHEQAVRWKTLTRQMGDDQYSVREKIEFVLARLENFDKERANRYRAKVEEFFSVKNGEWVHVNWVNHELRDIKDSGYVPIKRNCRIKQIAIQYATKAFEEDKTYEIVKELYDALDSDGKAGLVLHEVIYNEGISLGHLNSIKSRYFNALISSGFMTKITNRDYEARVSRVFGPEKQIILARNEYRYEIDSGAPFAINLATLKRDPNTKVEWWSDENISWLRLDSANSLLLAKPPEGEAGIFRFQIAAHIEDELAAISEIEIILSSKVAILPNQAMELGPLVAGRNFSLDLTHRFPNPKNEKLHIELKKGPAWMNMDGNTLVGKVELFGEYEFTGLLSVRLGQEAPRAVPFYGKVEGAIDAVAFDWLTLPMAYPGVEFRENLNDYLIDGFRGNIRFETPWKPRWLKISASGELTGTPEDADIGYQELVVTLIRTIEGQTYHDEFQFAVHVSAAPTSNRPPRWPNREVKIEVCHNKDTRFSLRAMDPNGDRVSYEVFDSPDWLYFQPNAKFLALKGAKENTSFRLEAHDGKSFATLKVILIVKLCRDDKDIVPMEQFPATQP